MNKIKIACVFAFAAFALGVFFTNNSLVPTVESNSGGPSTGRTGAPGETTCTACHTQNAGTGVFTITAPANYVPGEAYLIQVQHSTADATRLRWGFELTALDGTNVAAGQFSNSSSLTQTKSGLVGSNTRYYVEHTSAGTFAGTSGGATWTFNWVAPPTDVGPVTFYAAGNQADNDGTKLGDQIYTTTAISQSSGPACSGDIWTPTSTSPLSARDFHTAVWTGTEMIVWGGNDFVGVTNTGARYNPTTHSWTAMSTVNAPAARTYHSAVWTGSEMIVWGGSNGSDLNTGGRYNPATDTWTSISTTNAPGARQFPGAVWTGSEMIIWAGGSGGPTGQFDTGARYNPQTDTWTPITMTNVPTARFDHSAVWTGTEMIVWGGYNNTLGGLITGGRYNPVTDTWTATTTTGAPATRNHQTAVWTGTEMIVWGGSFYNTGASYNPATNTWTPTGTTNAPVGRNSHTAIWTGSEMIIWGGDTSGFNPVNTGARYSPSSGSWVPVTTSSAPTARHAHTAVWTGREMIVWGGSDASNNRFDTGGEYCDTLAPTPTPTNTATPTATRTSTGTPTNTPTNTATATPASSASNTATNTATVTATNTPTFTPTPFDCTTTMYASDTTSHYFAVNINTGAGTLVATLPLDTTTEIEYDPISGRAFAQGGATAYLGTEFDAATGAAIGSQINNNHTFTGLEWVGSTLYGTSIDGPSGPSTLRILDPWTGASSSIGDTGVGPISGLAYDQNTNTMYGVTGSAGSLYTIDLSSGVATVVGPTGISAGSLEFGPDGNLYAGGGQGATGNLYKINKTTGVGTLVGATGFGNVSGLMNVCALTPTATSTSTPTNTPTSTPTDTPTPSNTPSISGVITYGNAINNPPPPRFIRNVTVQSTAGSPAVGPVITGTPGAYTLTGFGATSYTIKPTKPGGANTAITSADAARVAQGVAGSVPFVSQNQRFAADTTGNGGPNPVSSQDAAFIARFAAGLTGFGRTGTWFFFVTGAPSPMPTAPQTYEDSRTYASVTGNLTGQDYVAILVGEVSGNYNPANNARPASGPEKSVSVELPKLAKSRAKELTVPVIVRGIADKDVFSYEFDLRYDPNVIQPLADPVDVARTASRGLSVVANSNEPGLLRVVLYGAFPIDRNGVLLNLRFVAVGMSGSVSPLSFERIMFNEGEPQAVTSDGLVKLF